MLNGITRNFYSCHRHNTHQRKYSIQKQGYDVGMSNNYLCTRNQVILNNEGKSCGIVHTRHRYQIYRNKILCKRSYLQIVLYFENSYKKCNQSKLPLNSFHKDCCILYRFKFRYQHSMYQYNHMIELFGLYYGIKYHRKTNSRCHWVRHFFY